MTDERPRPAAGAAANGDTPITGVARGGLGTGTALDDTQEWDMSALEASQSEPVGADASAARAAASPARKAEATRAASGAAVTAAHRAPATAPEPAPAAAAVADAEPIRRGPVRATHGDRPGRRSPVLAGVVAAIGLAFLIGVGIVATQGNILSNGLGGAPPVPASTATQPAVAGDEGADDEKDKGKGNCNGRGNDKCDREGGDEGNGGGEDDEDDD